MFGEGAEPTSILTSYGFCIIDSEDEEAIKEGFGLACSSVIALTKILVIGLSLISHL